LQESVGSDSADEYQDANKSIPLDTDLVDISEASSNDSATEVVEQESCSLTETTEETMAGPDTAKLAASQCSEAENKESLSSTTESESTQSGEAKGQPNKESEETLPVMEETNVKGKTQEVIPKENQVPVTEENQSTVTGENMSTVSSKNQSSESEKNQNVEVGESQPSVTKNEPVITEDKVQDQLDLSNNSESFLPDQNQSTMTEQEIQSPVTVQDQSTITDKNHSAVTHNENSVPDIQSQSMENVKVGPLNKVHTSTQTDQATNAAEETVHRKEKSNNTEGKLGNSKQQTEAYKGDLRRCSHCETEEPAAKTYKKCLK
jgi:hypothetical protein